MTSAQVVETSVANNSPSQDSSQADDHFQSIIYTFLLISVVGVTMLILLKLLDTLWPPSQVLTSLNELLAGQPAVQQVMLDFERALCLSLNTSGVEKS